jgi:hypothetical protein
MSAVMVAVFSSFRDAESVHTELIRGGFPTGRLELTSASGTARGSHSSPREYERYFAEFFSDRSDRSFVTELAKRVATGGVTTIAVHSRGAPDTLRVTQILENQGALQVIPDALVEVVHLNGSEAGSWLDYLLPEYAGAAGRFCLRPFP